jgi:hypothetical protein
MIDGLHARARYHRDRAMRELDAGLTASSARAARAHLELSNLQLSRARELSTEPSRPLIHM